MSNYTKGSATAILGDEELLRRRDKDSFDAGFNAGIDWQRDIRSELLEALKALRSFMWAEGYADQKAEMAKADAAIAKAEEGKQ